MRLLIQGWRERAQRYRVSLSALLSVLMSAALISGDYCAADGDGGDGGGDNGGADAGGADAGGADAGDAADGDAADGGAADGGAADGEPASLSWAGTTTPLAQGRAPNGYHAEERLSSISTRINNTPRPLATPIDEECRSTPMHPTSAPLYPTSAPCSSNGVAMSGGQARASPENWP